jgi:hypothetical protein
MRRNLRKVFVLLTALAFVAGMVQRSALAEGDPCPVNHQQTHSAHAGHTGHDGHHHGTPEQKKDAACAKCCGICVSTSTVVPAAMAGTIAVAPSRIEYALRFQRLADRPVVVDPGIPKRKV